MADAIWFVVQRRHGDETPMMVHGPSRPPRAGQDGIVYVLRVDNHPECGSWARMRPSQVYSLYCGILGAGASPPQSVPDRPVAKQPTRRLLGEWWFPSKKPWRETADAAPEGGA